MYALFNHYSKQISQIYVPLWANVDHLTLKQCYRHHIRHDSLNDTKNDTNNVFGNGDIDLHCSLPGLTL